MRIWNSTVRK